MRVTGRFTTSMQPVVPVTVAGPAGRPKPVHAVIDTGFAGYLALPGRMVEKLRLPFIDFTTVRLADGLIVRLREFEARVEWLGALREVPVIEAEGGPLVGMSLLHGCIVRLDVAAGGAVDIEARPA